MEFFKIPFYIAKWKHGVVNIPAGERVPDADGLAARIQSLDAEWTCIHEDGWVHVGLPTVPGHVSVKVTEVGNKLFYGCTVWGSPAFLEKVNMKRICSMLGENPHFVDRYPFVSLSSAMTFFAHCFTGYMLLVLDFLQPVGKHTPHSEALCRFYLAK